METACLVIEDNGVGWKHEDFIKILTSYDTDDVPEDTFTEAKVEKNQEEEDEKIFNSEEEEEKERDAKRKKEEAKAAQESQQRSTNEYSFNFKVASMRLGKNIIFISVNGDEISLGFLSADRRFNPNLHRNHAFYYSWKKSTGEYLTRRAEKNRSIIWNTLDGIFSVEELLSGTDKVGNRIIVLDLKTVLGSNAGNQKKENLELLLVKKGEPDGVNDIMVRSLDKNLKPFYRDPSTSLVDLSLRTYLSYFALNPIANDINIYLNGTQVQLINVKDAIETRASRLDLTRINEDGKFEGTIINQFNRQEEVNGKFIINYCNSNVIEEVMDKSKNIADTRGILGKGIS